MSILRGDTHVDGHLTAKTLGVPIQTISNSHIAPDADIDGAKLRNNFHLHYAQAPGSPIVAGTEDLRIVRGGSGLVVDVEGAITGAIATGADREVSVDVQVGNASTAFTSILTAPLTFDNGDALRTPKTATVDDDELADGDIIRVVVSVSGAAGAQAQGLNVTITIREKAS